MNIWRAEAFASAEAQLWTRVLFMHHRRRRTAAESAIRRCIRRAKASSGTSGVNHKRVYRLVREDNLLCLRRRKFVVTTDSAHPLPVYPNLAREMTLTGLDQLWVADITYI